MSGTSSIPTIYQHANPLLYTLRDSSTAIQPYWLMISQFFVFEISLRGWNRAVYGSWLLPRDYIIVHAGGKSPTPIATPFRTLPIPGAINISSFRSRSNPYAFTVSTIYILQCHKKWGIEISKKQNKPKFDLSDIVVSVLPLLAHSIWYCYIQSSCLSAESATVWNCYNIFGYRLYNYVFDDYISFLDNFISKLILMYRDNENENMHDQGIKKWRNILSRIIHYISLSSSVITFFFVGALVVPYLFTNVIPMIFTYIFFAVVYIYALTIITLVMQYMSVAVLKYRFIFASRLHSIFRDRHQIVMKAAIALFPYIMSILFNFSQYFYYGEDYLQTMTNEFQSRDPEPYFEQLRTQPAQIFHTILTTI
jgi:hypothetical protein